MSKQEQLPTEGFMRLDGVLRVYDSFQLEDYDPGAKHSHEMAIRFRQKQ